VTERELRDLLATFVEQHRGLRFGRLFGQPAGYAGRRVFAYVSSGGLAVRSRGRWVVHRPSGIAATRELLRQLERSVLEAAEG
jgi:hypothetical protein